MDSIEGRRKSNAKEEMRRRQINSELAESCEQREKYA